MMTLSVCVETYGAAVHVIDSLIGVSAEPVTRRGLRSHFGRGPNQRTAVAELTHGDAAFAQQVRRAIHGLCFEQAQALWLIDVCNCSYAEAAAEAAISRDELAARVATGRRAVREGLATSPVAVPVG